MYKQIDVLQEANMTLNALCKKNMPKSTFKQSLANDIKNCEYVQYKKVFQMWYLHIHQIELQCT